MFQFGRADDGSGDDGFVQQPGQRDPRPRQASRLRDLRGTTDDPFIGFFGRILKHAAVRFVGLRSDAFVVPVAGQSGNSVCGRSGTSCRAVRRIDLGILSFALVRRSARRERACGFLHLPSRILFARTLSRGWARVQSATRHHAERRRDAVETLRGCLAELSAAHYGLQTTSFRISFVQGLAAIGRFAEGIAHIDETIRMIEARGELSYLPEALRVKGNVILSMPPHAPDDAEICFMRSLEWSRRQGARAWELLTAVDLAAMWARSGHSRRAWALLRPIVDQFAEGTDWVGLKAAERLLAGLGQDGSR
jgi:hypothetical protein